MKRDLTCASREPVFRELTVLSREELLKIWERQMGGPPPKAMSSALALRAIAYDLQVKAHGGLKRHELQALLRAAATDQGISAIQKDKRISNVPPTFLPDGNDFRASPKPKQKKHCLRSKPKPGTRLIRNWQGEAQVVDVFQEGYGWRGKIFRSLTVIAKEITGTHQSGPRFFRT